ncbi:MAG TPA: hypothetical protein VFJ58_22555 [Armatimonadota bacterium]|nr:hypothetical protein [Armatimonadota bacterium]
MLHFPSPIAHRGARAAAVAIAGAVVAFIAWPRTQTTLAPLVQTAPAAPRIIPAPKFVPPVLHSRQFVPPVAQTEPTAQETRPRITFLSGELSLQQTLDRLGYTVNVPRSYAGHPLFQWSSDRVSDRSDAIQAVRFMAHGRVSFAMVSQQSYCGPRSEFIVRFTGWPPSSILSAPGIPCPWLSPDALVRTWFTATGQFEVFIQHPVNNTFGPNTGAPLYSQAKENPEGGTQLLVLPAKTHGKWVTDKPGVGHWSGGRATGVYLLCWEDTTNGDHDYNDIVIVAHGIRPLSK